MESTRAVRIPVARSRTPPREIDPNPPASGRAATGDGERKENRSGVQRAVRTFLAFLAALIAIYGTFLVSFLTAPYSGVRSNPSEYAVFSVLFVVIGLYGAAVTLFRAPLEVRTSGSTFFVRERTGRVRRFSTPPGFDVLVLKRYPAGPLSDASTELVQLSQPHGRPHVYLVETGLLPVPPAG